MKSFFNSGDAQPPFTEDDLIPIKQTLTEFIQYHGLVPDWSMRAAQPMQLSIMAALSRILDDRDTTLFPMLLAGAPTGFDGDIPASGCFPPTADKRDDTVQLSFHSINWQSAEYDLPTTRDLVFQELEKGWIYKYTGTLADTQ